MWSASHGLQIAPGTHPSGASGIDVEAVGAVPGPAQLKPRTPEAMFMFGQFQFCMYALLFVLLEDRQFIVRTAFVAMFNGVCCIFVSMSSYATSYALQV